MILHTSFPLLSLPQDFSKGWLFKIFKKEYFQNSLVKKKYLLITFLFP